MSSGSQKVWKVRLIVTIIVLVALGFAGYWWRGHLFSAFGFVTEATGGKTSAALSIALALSVLFCLLSWLILPIIVYFGLKDLRRRSADLDQTTQMCARLLAQLAARQEPLKLTSEKKPEQQANG